MIRSRYSITNTNECFFPLFATGQREDYNISSAAGCNTTRAYTATTAAAALCFSCKTTEPYKELLHNSLIVTET